jgi:hypothetical protein
LVDNSVRRDEICVFGWKTSLPFGHTKDGVLVK